jgi:nitroreductase
MFKTLTKFGKPKKRIKVPDESEIDTETPYVSRIDSIFSTVDSVIKGRRSVRKYQNKEIDFELIRKILEAARFAPSAGNYQPWEFIVVRDPEMKKSLVEAASNEKWMLEAPVFIVVCINSRLAGAMYSDRGLKLYGTQGVAAAIENILLSAQSLGLATCWVGAFSEIMVARLLECPEYVRPCAIITLGYSYELRCGVPARQNLEEFVHIGKFGNTLHLEFVKKEKRSSYMKFQ